MSDMTPLQRAWLTKLRDEGPQKANDVGVAAICELQGWTEWVNPPRHETGDFRERITPAGLAALAKAEARDE